MEKIAKHWKRLVYHRILWHPGTLPAPRHSSPAIPKIFFVSFGKLVSKTNPSEGVKEEDLARALLLMVTNNVGQVAHLNAKLHKTSRIYFIGGYPLGSCIARLT